MKPSIPLLGHSKPKVGCKSLLRIG